MEVNVLRRVSSTAQSAAPADGEEREGFNVATVAEDERFSGLTAMQKGEVLFTQKTSRQQAVTPRFGGRFMKEEEEETFGIDGGGFGWDWRRTRTTSRGVTRKGDVSCVYALIVEKWCLPRSDVRRLPETAESIFWTAEMSMAVSSVSRPLGSSMITRTPGPRLCGD